jgi:hypothetical protein
LELPTFEAHQHSAKFLPGDLSAIDDEDWYAAIVGVVPFNPAPDNLLCDLQAKFSVRKIFRRQGASNPLDQASKQREQVVFGFADDLKLVGGRLSVAEFECVDRNPRPD